MNIAKELLKGFKGKAGKILGFRSATLLRITPGTRTPGAAASGTNPTTTPYPCKALISLATAANVPSAILVQQDDRKISIFGASLPSGIVPRINDKVTIVDIDKVSKTLRLIAPIQGDGTGAMFEFTARA